MPLPCQSCVVDSKSKTAGSLSNGPILDKTSRITRLDRVETGLRRNLLAVSLLVGLVALALRILLIFGVMRVPSIDWDEMELISRSIAETGQFANPYKLPTGLTAHHAPVYPFLLAGIFKALGYGPAAA